VGISRKIIKLLLCSTLILCGGIIILFIEVINRGTVQNSQLEYNNKNLLLIMLLINLGIIISNIIIYFFIKKIVINKLNLVTDSIKVLTDDKKDNNEDDITYITNYDKLTGLLNRNSIMEYINKLIIENKEFSVYSIDLDNFKNINETLGYKSGDQVLRIIGSKLKLFNEDGTKIGRISGDEFILVKEEENSEIKSKYFIERIFNILSETYKFNVYSFNINLSVGVSYYPKHSNDPSTLIKYSSISMNSCKKYLGNKFEIFSDVMMEDIRLENMLTEAVKRKEFEVYFQPIYNMKSSKVIGAEALVRWIRNDEIISPIKFIPLAKKNGEIIEIDKFVIKEATSYCKKIIDLGEEDFKVSVNLSYALLKQSYVVDTITEIVKNEGLDPKYIKLEITEDETIDDIDFVIDILKKLKNEGFEISLDDFGVGYSSLNHLKRLPIDTLKIDRSLLLSIESDKKTREIIEMLINLCHTLKLDIVCEGVEEKKQMDLLKKLKCDKIQGYYISKPIRKDDFSEFIIKVNSIIV